MDLLATEKGNLAPWTVLGELVNIVAAVGTLVTRLVGLGLPGYLKCTLVGIGGLFVLRVVLYAAASKEPQGKLWRIALRVISGLLVILLVPLGLGMFLSDVSASEDLSTLRVYVPSPGPTGQSWEGQMNGVLSNVLAAAPLHRRLVRQVSDRKSAEIVMAPAYAANGYSELEVTIRDRRIIRGLYSVNNLLTGPVQRELETALHGPAVEMSFRVDPGILDFPRIVAGYLRVFSEAEAGSIGTDLRQMISHLPGLGKDTFQPSNEFGVLVFPIEPYSGDTATADQYTYQLSNEFGRVLRRLNNEYGTPVAGCSVLPRWFPFRPSVDDVDEKYELCARVWGAGIVIWGRVERNEEGEFCTISMFRSKLPGAVDIWQREVQEFTITGIAVPAQPLQAVGCVGLVFDLVISLSRDFYRVQELWQRLHEECGGSVLNQSEQNKLEAIILVMRAASAETEQEKLRQINRAIELLTQLAEGVGSRDPTVYGCLGWAYMRRASYLQASTVYAHALTLRPGSFWYLYNYAVALRFAGNSIDAIRDRLRQRGMDRLTAAQQAMLKDLLHALDSIPQQP